MNNTGSRMLIVPIAEFDLSVFALVVWSITGEHSRLQHPKYFMRYV